MDSNILKILKEKLPKFNDYLLKEYREKQVNSSVDFISDRLTEVIKIVEGTPIQYKGYKIYSPEERATFEIEEGIIKNSINIRSNEVMLVGFDFEYKEQIYTFKLYIPYLYDGFLVLNNTKYSISFSFTEKLFSRIKNGISLKVIRVPIQFNNDILYQFTNTEGVDYVESIISTDIHRKKAGKKNEIRQTIIHYLLCKHGFINTINRFGISKEDMSFSEEPDDIINYEYFSLKKSKNTYYLKVKKEIMGSIIVRRIIANISYILCNFRKHQIEDFRSENNYLTFRLMLGKVIHGRTLHQTMIYSYMQNHFNSVDSYLDSNTKYRFRLSKIELNDIYDLLTYVFLNIDKILVGYSNNNLYERRVDIFQTALVRTIIENIYLRFYTFGNRTNSNKDKYIKNLFGISPKIIYHVYEMSNIRYNSGLYHDNWLISIGGKATKMFNNMSVTKGGGNKGANAGSGELAMSYCKFHPSFAVIESLIDFASNPTASSVINPFAIIDDDGGFIKPEWAKSLDNIQKYLSN